MVVSPPSLSRQPSRLMAALPGLNNSNHSSLLLAAVPPQATSLITTARGAIGAGVNVAVGVGPLVGVSVGVGVGIGWLAALG